MADQRAALEALKASTAVTVSADMIAPVLGMSPGVLRKHVVDGDYKLSAVEVCGSRIRFPRKDFLVAIGEIPAEKPPDRMEMILQELAAIRETLAEIAGAGNKKDLR